MGVNIITGKEKEIIFNKLNYFLYVLYINIYFGWNYAVLIRKYFKSSGIIKTQLAYIIIGTLVSTLIGLTTNLLLPTFGIFALNWVGQVGIIVMLTTIFYAILKHHLFDIKDHCRGNINFYRLGCIACPIYFGRHIASKIYWVKSVGFCRRFRRFASQKCY